MSAYFPLRSELHSQAISMVFKFLPIAEETIPIQPARSNQTLVALAESEKAKNPWKCIFVACPKTGQPVFTRLTTDSVVFKSLPPVGVPLHCPACGKIPQVEASRSVDRAIGLISDDASWQVWHRKQITIILSIAAAVENQPGKNTGTEPLAFERIVTEDDEPGTGILNMSKIVREPPPDSDRKDD
jgi:hypothetical protein